MFDANEIINGTYGSVYDENGAEVQAAESFEASVEYEKEEIKIAGKFLVANKVMGGKGTGNLKLHHVDTRLQKKILENPTAKYNYVGKLADPTARGEEAVLLIGVSFNGTPLMNYELGALGEIELEFTFDNCRYTKTIE